MNDELTTEQVLTHQVMSRINKVVYNALSENHSGAGWDFDGYSVSNVIIKPCESAPLSEVFTIEGHFMVIDDE